MPIVTAVGFGQFEVPAGRKLVLALEDNGVAILHRCGGKAKCTTCRVEVLEGDYQEISKKKALMADHIIDDQLRLSCQMAVSGDITIRPIKTVENSGLDAGPRPEE
ncbi:2Fe-2S iron-sulfur cluster-binding protein [Peribacillus sp. SCS-37]|uniref:2Fe-2S iron-sulfur cluster-binding protein n=1 Tax=Paraperibacillus esterisolvens TaxID=3115296 RepID=UPI0039069542